MLMKLYDVGRLGDDGWSYGIVYNSYNNNNNDNNINARDFAKLFISPSSSASASSFERYYLN